jgi:hypothetical protein
MTTTDVAFPQQLFGFTRTGEVIPPVAPTHRNDPETSSIVAQDRKLRVKWNSERMLLLAAFAVHAARSEDGLIDEEAAQIVFEREAVVIDSIESTRRCATLRRDGLIEVTGEKRPKGTGNLSQVCRITRAGHDALAGIRQHRRSDAA